MRYLKMLLLSISLLSPVAAQAHDGGHIWGEERCPFPWGQIGNCRQRTCLRTCTRPGCLVTVPSNQVDCSRSEAPIEVMPASIWGPRPGSSGSGECPPHDWGDEECAGWSTVKPGCEIRHCTRQCKKCRTNGRDRYDDRPAGCF